MPNPVELKTPDDNLIYEFDWTPQMGAGVVLQTVRHIVPSPLVMTAEITDQPSGHSLVEIAGGVHGALYVITAQAILSSGENVVGVFTLRVLQPG